MIPVTKPFLPPISEYYQILEEIWDREYLTNNGPVVNQLEKKLSEYLDVDNILFLANGTLALQLAIKALGLKGDIITTPFSYVATTTSIVWEGCSPVYVDIDPYTFNIDPKLIEEAITPNTTAILATHVFGNPCDIDSIKEIADKHSLKVIYDAAHCFGTRFKGRSIFQYGDVSTASFHATKIFHTVEGGAVFAKKAAIIERMMYMRNFGHDGPAKFNGIGINAKNSEIHAAMGLCNLKYIDEIMTKRKEQSKYYDENLSELFFLSMQKINPDSDYFNFSYYPIVFDIEERLLKALENLEHNNIFPRRYFYPSLTALDYVEGDTPISDSIAERILCLPLYHDLTFSDQHKIIEILKDI